MKKSIARVLIANQSADDREEAMMIIEEMIQRVNDGEQPDDVLHEYGLEPDYAMDLIMLISK